MSLYLRSCITTRCGSQVTDQTCFNSSIKLERELLVLKYFRLLASECCPPLSAPYHFTSLFFIREWDGHGWD